MRTKSILLRSFFALLALVVVLPSAGFADNLTGRVLDPQGNLVPGAQVRLFDRKNGQLRKTISDSEGGYSFPGIPAGDYLLEGDASSAALTGSRQISVSGDQTTDIELKISSTNVEVSVLAAGTAQSVEEIAKSIDVIDSEQIAQRDELSITDAVRTLPGIRVQQLEGPGSFVTIKTRGLPNAATAVLVDGMRFRDAASIQGDATAFLSDMTVVDTERIEFLRGSGSSLYGSHALGGVINVSSRPGGGKTHGDIRVEGGGLGMIRGILGIGGGLADDRFTYSGGLAHTNVTKGTRDGMPYRNTGTQSAAKYSFTPQISLSGRLWYSDSYSTSTESSTYTGAMVAGNPGPISPIPLPLDQLELFERKQPYSRGDATFIPNQIDPDGRRLGKFLTGAFSFQHQVAPASSYRVGYQRVDTKRRFIDGPAGPGSFEPAGASRSNFNGYVDTVQAALSQGAGAHNLITVGYEFEREQYFTFNGTTSTTNSVDLRQRSNAFYAQDQIRLVDGQLQLTVSGRVQNFTLKPPVFTGATSNPYSGVSTVEPPTSFTGDGSIAYFFRESNTKLRSHVGNSFRAPAGYERFGGGSGGVFYGDPELASERAIAVDAGIDQWLLNSKLQLGATYFYTKLQEQIIFGTVTAAPYSRPFGGYRNGGAGIARGLELSGKVSPVQNTNVQVSYTYTNSESRTPTFAAISFYDTLGISKHSFTATVTQWIGDRVNIAFDMSALSDYVTPLFGLDFSSRPYRFNGPTKADVVVHYDHPLSDNRKLEFYTKVENVFNQRAYENGFIGPKAWAVGGVRLKY